MNLRSWRRTTSRTSEPAPKPGEIKANEGIVFSAESLRDLDEIWLRIAADNLDAAERLIGRVESNVSELARFPGIGHRRADVRNKDYRFWAPAKSAQPV